MDQGSYGQFCPVAMAAEIVCTRWTALVLRELLCGSRRFNDLRKGVPRMSPALLSQRLKDLETAGVLRRDPAPGDPGVLEYRLTEAGRDRFDQQYDDLAVQALRFLRFHLRITQQNQHQQKHGK